MKDMRKAYKILVGRPEGNSYKGLSRISVSLNFSRRSYFPEIRKITCWCACNRTQTGRRISITLSVI